MAFFCAYEKHTSTYAMTAYHLSQSIGDNQPLIYYNNDLREVLRHNGDLLH